MELRRENHLPCPAGHVSCGSTQAIFSFLGCKCTKSHKAFNPPIHPSPPPTGCSKSLSIQPVFMLGIVVAQVQDLLLGLDELYEVHMESLEPVQVPQDDIPSLQCVNCITQLGVVGKLAEGA